MDNELKAAVWEITYGCNLRCKHCGSSCSERTPDELTTGEALKLCDELGELNLKYLTISGGEPFLRKDWPIIVKQLVKNGVITNAISNGWLIDEKLIEQAKEAGLNNIAVSIDGLEETHDFIRAKNSYKRALLALDVMQKMGMPSVVSTSINKRNLSELPLMKKTLVDLGVERWQFQIAMPMGNLLQYPELVFAARDIDKVIDFAYDVSKEKRILIDLTDSIGYYNRKQMEILSVSHGDDGDAYLWLGCPAGKRSLGIRSNGDIIGCLSIRDESFIEGNVREIPLKELWTREGAFSWNRGLMKKDLTGTCGKCQFGAYCLGGCSSLKFFMDKTLNENSYCSYRIALEDEEVKIKQENDVRRLIKKSRELIDEEEFQLAEMHLSHGRSIDPENNELLELSGFTHYSLENYTLSKEVNEQAIALNPQNAYATKGLGLCLVKLGELEEGIAILKKAIELTDNSFLEPYYDLSVVLMENNRLEEAVLVLEEGRSRTRGFKERSQNLYETIKKMSGA